MISNLPSQKRKRRILFATNGLPREPKVDASSSTPPVDVDIERPSQTVREPLLHNSPTSLTRIPIFNDAEIQNLLELVDYISKECSQFQ